jgi:hypothetical protein
MIVALSSAPAAADWFPGDPYKMHEPQLPDPTGWDVDFTAQNVLADDWLCTESGPVSDVHFWYSWAQDAVGIIDNVHVSIHANIPAGEGGIPYSRPGELLWMRDFSPGQFTTRFVSDTSPQGFLFPPLEAIPQDHFAFYQLNIVDIVDPFVQEMETTYWLDLSVLIRDPVGTHIGWKTSLTQWFDDAVFWDGQMWQELRDPLATERSLDLAFVITPEPASLWLLALGSLCLWRRR